MKKLFLSFLALTAAVSAFGVEGALDPGSLSRLRQIRFEQKLQSYSPQQRKLGAKLLRTGEPVDYVGSFVKLQPGATAADLEALGLNVLTVRGNIAICMVPVDRVEEIAAAREIKSMSLGRKLRTNMDKSRQAAGLDAVHAGETVNGEQLRLPYTGKGIQLSVVDEGIDPGHLNFLNPDGTHRVAYLTHLVTKNEDPGYEIRAYSNEEYFPSMSDFTTEIGSFSTDNADAYHGTHTLGIAGGNYRGDVTMADYSRFTDPKVKVPLITQTNPYYGAAPDATLTASCGSLNDYFIAYGIDQMCSFACDKNLPMVLSMSLGSNSGPHDVNSMMSQFLDLTMTKSETNPNPPIIFISAGNEGDHKIAIRKTLYTSEDVLKTLIWPYYAQYEPDVEGSVTARQDDIAIYAADDTPLDVQAVIYNKSRGYRAALRMPVVGDNIGTYYITDEYFQVTESDINSAQLAKWFDGMVGVGGTIDSDTGRYYAMVDYALQNKPENLDDNYVLGFEVKVREGHAIPEGGLVVEAYCSGQTTEMYNYRQSGFDDGSCNGSISDMAVSPKLIVVGSYNTRPDWLCLDGLQASYISEDPYYFKEGYVSGFSSFGTLADGRNLPTVCGPGSSVISSVNRYYSRRVSDDQVDFTFQAKATDSEGNINYWKQEPGTSMSTPFVAGAVACWLEADPTLEYDEVREIIQQTATVDEQVLAADDPVRWGAGKFDALEGLKEVLRRKTSSIGEVSADDDSRLILTPDGENRYSVFMAGASRIEVSVFDTRGMAMRTFAGDSDEITADLQGLGAGIYIISANGCSRKVTVK